MSKESCKVIKRRGLVKKHAVVDLEVWQWKIQQEEVKGGRLTKAEVQAYAVQAYHHAGIANFKASDGWYRRWRVRWQQMASDPSPVKVALEGDVNGGHPNTNGENLLMSISLGSTGMPTQKDTKDLDVSGKKSKDSHKSMLEVPDKNNFESKRLINDSRYQGKCHKLHHVNTEICSEIRECKNSLPSNRCDLLINGNVSDCKTGQASLNSSASMQIDEEPQNKTDIDKVDTQDSQTSQNTTDFIVILKDPNTKKLPVSNTKLIKNTEDQVASINSDTAVSTLNEAIPSNIVLSLTPPSSSSSFDTYYTSPALMYQNDFDFGDELFCDTCEDFHARHSGSLVKCQKRIKRTDNKLLLSGVTKGKESAVEGLQEVVQLEEEESETEERKFVNPGVERAKGKRYLEQFKNCVVTFALAHTAKMAAIKFKINRGTVCDWLSQHQKVYGAEPKVISTDEGVKSHDSEFLRWLEDSKFNLTNERLRHKTAEWLTSEDTDKSSQWLRMYAHRLNGSPIPIAKRRYIAYPNVFKRVAVFHAQTHSNIAAARVFGVSRRRIVEWQAAAGASKSGEAKEERFPGVPDASVDRAVFAWYSAQDPTPSGQQVRSKALELYREAGHSLQCGTGWYYRWRARHSLPPARSMPSAENRLLVWALVQMEHRRLTHAALADQAAALGITKVSKKWTAGFCRRRRNLLQEAPDPSAELPAHLEQQASDFRLTLGPNLDPTASSRVISMDQIVLHFLSAEQRSKKSVLWRPPLRSARASVVISCSADGTLLPSLLILKGCETFVSSDPRVICASSNTGIINEDIFLKWINDVCLKYLQGSEGGVLVTNSLPLHRCQAGAHLLESHRVHHATTPPGTACHLLPVLPVCHIFKSMIEEIGLSSLDDHPSPLSFPSADQLLQWTLEAHNYVAKLQAVTIRNAFQEMLFVPNAAIPVEPD